jgi:hypothetical protein
MVARRNDVVCQEETHAPQQTAFRWLRSWHERGLDCIEQTNRRPMNGTTSIGTSNSQKP